MNALLALALEPEWNRHRHVSHSRPFVDAAIFLLLPSSEGDAEDQRSSLRDGVASHRVYLCIPRSDSESYANRAQPTRRLG
jgi:hypothetical protein